MVRVPRNADTFEAKGTVVEQYRKATARDLDGDS